MLCDRCRHQNPNDNRFCGMCGSPLEALPESVEEVSSREPVHAGASSRSVDTIFGLDFEPVREELFQREAAHEATRREPEQRQPAKPELRSEPVQRERLQPEQKPSQPEPPKREPLQRESTISGPSFLGIGAEPERRSSGYSYLLDYEEPSSHRGLWMVLVLLVVAVLVGLQFRNELRAWAMPVYSAVQARVSPKPAPQAAAPAAASGTPAPNSAAPETATPPPASGNASEKSPSAGTPPDTGSRSPSAASQPAPSKSDDHATADEKAAAPAKPDTKEEAAPSKKPAAQYARASRPKPPETAAPPEDNRSLVLAQKYIRGEGVRRDCTTGLAYLREAMKHPSAAAATQMGALYATGTCMPMDRVAAYRWFGSALQMTPNNTWLARERDELYAQMSSAERQRANAQ